MGIKGLTKLLSDEAPDCIREVELSSLTGRKVAIDASMAMYQFLIAVRSGGDGQSAQMLTNEAGEVTSHIQGMFNRTIRILANGIKPVYIFDGRPPTLKGGELLKRTEKRVKAEEELKAATEAGVVEDVDKFSKRLVKVTKQHNEDCKELLRLMGVPVVDALSEAESQCAVLAQAGIVYGTATEDMDALTFKTPKLLRRMTFAANKNQPIMEVDYAKAVCGLELTHEQFVDLCILCGCDYTDHIKGIGPKKALTLIRQHKSIEGILKALDRTKYEIPNDWLDAAERKRLAHKNDENANAQEALPEDETPAMDLPMFQEARRIFINPEVYPPADYNLKWSDPDEEGLTKFLVEKMQFDAGRVKGGIAKLKDARKLTSQRRVDSFFKAVPAAPSQAGSSSKRKPEPAKGKGAPAKKAKTAAGKPRR